MSSLISINVGLPRDVEWRGMKIRTAIWKSRVKGKVKVSRLQIEGDGQADFIGHGGENRAVMVYQAQSYRYWEKYLQRSDFVYGQFGENLTVDGLEDDQVCIGDRFRIGSAVFEISQPRVTCNKLAIRMNHAEIPALRVSHRRPGFYFRVIEEGEICAGDLIIKIAGGPEKMTVAEIDALLNMPHRSIERLQKALRIPALSNGWQGSFESLLDAALKNSPIDYETRIHIERHGPDRASRMEEVDNE